MLGIYDSLTRTVRPFEPLIPGKVTLYVCGQTVYDAPHLGHARKDVGFDVIVRWLEASGYHVTYVRNLTDIDDKIIARAGELGEPIGAFTQRMIDKTRADYRALRLRAPDHEPRATDYVADMIALAGQLQASGIAYHDKDLFYAVRSFAGYGKLSGRMAGGMRSGKRVRIDERKQDPLDFVLWKASKPHEPAEAIWQSPWGPGRPGWHLECSAMARALLGDTIDIHGGGPDLKFPHHENEIAQSEAVTHAPLARWWMHAGQLNVDGRKMSKSDGNSITLQAAIERFGGDVVRFYFSRVHYRSMVNCSEAGLADAASGYQRLQGALEAIDDDGEPLDWNEPNAMRFRAAMDDDFNSSEAVAVLFELASEVHRHRSASAARQLKELASVLNLAAAAPAETSDMARVELSILAREQARVAGDYLEADRIRATLERQGIILDDTPEGPRWRQKAA